MIKHYCDRCGKEIDSGRFAVDFYEDCYQSATFEVCENCWNLIKRITSGEGSNVDNTYIDCVSIEESTEDKCSICDSNGLCSPEEIEECVSADYEFWSLNKIETVRTEELMKLNQHN